MRSCVFFHIAVAISLACFIPACATDVSGPVSGTWTLSGSPYTVIDHVTVPAGHLLTIEPGVQVLFTGHYKVNVLGRLQAIGTAQDSIIFTRAFPTEESKWWGIRFVAADGLCILEYCRIEYGRATPGANTYDDAGGGIMSLLSSPLIRHCLITNNYAARTGGGILVDSSDPTIENCVISGNICAGTGDGGGIGSWLSSPVISGCLIVGNSVIGSASGSAIGYDNWSTEPIIVNCTIAGNSSTNGSGPVWSTFSTAQLSNCIVWGNSSETVNAQVRYSDIQGGYFGEGNIDGDPRFVNAVQGDFHLLRTSPCIDAGDPASPHDPDGTLADMGAYPYNQGVPLWTTIDFPGGFTGLGCPCEYPVTLREGSQVWLRRDLGLDGVSSDDSVVSSFSVMAGAGLPPWDGRWTPLPAGGFTNPNYYVQLITDDCCWLSGPIEWNGGYTTTIDAASWSCGTAGDPHEACGASVATPVCGAVSGVWDLSGSPYIVTCDITVTAGQSLDIRPGVRVLFSGHYRFNVYGTLRAVGTERDSISFTRQFPTEASRWWGIRFHDNSNDDSRLEYCVVEHAFKGEGNDHDTNGGGLLCVNASPTFAHCTIRYNESSRGGGLMGFQTSRPTIDHCVFARNRSPWTGEGGGLWIGLSGGTVTNSTIVNNWPGGLQNEVGVTLVNTIIACNTGAGITGSHNVIARYCNFFGNSTEIGGGLEERRDTTNANGDSCDANFNIFLDPQFADTLLDDYSLTASSPCLNAGDPNSPRDPDFTIADIGAIPFTFSQLGHRLHVKVEHLVIARGPDHSIRLHWSPVTHTLSGQPFTPAYYIIYGSPGADGPFTPLGTSRTTSYHHASILTAPPSYFYQVSAAPG
ncbi:right-handed parallel beta-helix repeat-containing protein [candidate division KSB1 bacterium]|nr:right-handed parallel beta-helix repeat-containing protein [candidate division KSB1 bacterium]